MDKFFSNLSNKFINKQSNPKSPVTTPTDEGSSKTTDGSNPLVHPAIPEYRRPVFRKPDPALAEQILNSINPVYFSSEGFDASEHELKKLPEILDTAAIMKDLELLKQQHTVVSKKVLQLIQQKEAACQSEFDRFMDVHNKLNMALRICREGRTNLNLAKCQFTTSSLRILANYQKRQVIHGLLLSLNNIKTLQRMEEKLQELLGVGNYHGAILLLQECQQAASTYRRFNCVVALSGKLQDTLVMAEQQLDEALSKVCNGFDSDHYSKIQEAYRLLGKTQPAIDQLLMHFTSAIHTAAFNVVYGHVELSGASDGRKKQYQQLCKLITSDNLIPCLLDLCKALWVIMRNFTHVCMWHYAENTDREKISRAESLQEAVDFEASCNKEYVKTKLKTGLERIWQDVQMRVCTYLRESRAACCKFEEFMQVLRVVHRLTEVGEEFYCSKPGELQKLMKEQSGQYFRNYHRGRLEELRIFLENEGWEICPVKQNFTVLQLQEFRSFRGVLKGMKLGSPECGSSNQSLDGSSTLGGFFTRYADAGSPFDMSVDETQEEDILANIGDEPSGYFSDESDEDIPEELKKDYVEENVGESSGNKHASQLRSSTKKHVRQDIKALILTNTSLTVLRQCGKYMQLSRLLRPVAGDVLLCMSQLLEYYLYAVHSFFTVDLPDACGWKYSTKLKEFLDRIRHSLIQTPVLDGDAVPVSKDKSKIAEPCVSPVVDLSQPEALHGLELRVVAVESGIFLAKQFELLHCYLEKLGAGSGSPFLQQLYHQMVDVAIDLRLPVYACVSSHAVGYVTTLNHMKKVDWEVKNVMSQHSQYVDILLREIQIFSMRLEAIVSRVPIPHEVYNILWEHIIHEICNTFVEGFSNAKKCSVGGRGLMQLDFTHFLSKLEKLTTLRPIPKTEYVEHYVKAYYMPEKTLEAWIQEHCDEYTCEQLKALVKCACQSDSKTRQRLEALVKSKR